MTLIVAPLRLVERLAAERSPSHVITLLSPDEMIGALPGYAARHLRLGVHDIAFPMAGLTHPTAALVETILDFGAGWDDAAAPLLVHCWAGISRSTAAAYVLACARNPAADELAIARCLREASPRAFPNRRIVALADDILGRGGRMLEAVEAIGGDALAFENEPFDLAARHG